MTELQILLALPKGKEGKKEQAYRQQLIKGIQEKTMLQIKTGTEGILKTSSAEDIVKKIYNGLTWITITGRPGEGKSTFAYAVLKELQRRGRDVFQVTSAEEFSLITRTYSRPIILLNKIFSDVVNGQTECGKWKETLSVYWEKKKHESDGQEFDRPSGPTVVLVEHDYFLISAFYYHGKLAEFITQPSHVFDVSNVLDVSEKMNICMAIAEHHEIDLNPSTVRSICMQNAQLSAPHACRLFAILHKDNSNLSSDYFLTSPYKLFQEEIKRIMNDELNTSLFKEIVRQEGKVSDDDLNQMDQGPEILQAANDLVDRYLLKENNFFMFLNLSIYNMVEYIICSTFPLFVIKNCGLSVIKRRLVLSYSTYSKGQEKSNVVQICRKHSVALAERFSSEVERENIYLVLSHEACSCEWFIAKMMQQCNLTMTQLLDLKDSHSKEAFLCLIASNKSANLLKYMDQNNEILTSEIRINIILYGVCKYAATDALIYLEGVCEVKKHVCYEDDKGRTPLMIAAETKDKDLVQRIMAHNPDLAVRDKDGATVLHYLSENGLQSAVEDVISNRALINVTDKFGLSPLHCAARVDDMAIIKLLLDKGAKPDVKVMDAACKKWTTDVVKMLFKGISVNMELAAGYTPLHSACAGGNMPVINFLIENGASVNSAHKSPLHIAASHNEPEVVKCLLRQCVKVKCRDRYNETPLHYASAAGSKACLELLLDAKISGISQITKAEVDVQNSNGSTPLHKAAKVRSKECIIVLLKAGADVNAKRKDGLTPLHIASGKGAEECVNILVNAGGAVNTVNTTGYTPLHEAAKWGFKECLDVLLKNGADVSVLNDNHQSPLHKAAEIGSQESVDLLLKNNAEVNVKTKSGKTPLHFAAESKSEKCVSSLLKARADANIQDHLGFVPLHLAAKAGSEECMQLLLDTRMNVNAQPGMDVNAQTKDGDTPLHQSAEIASVTCVELLLKKGANVNTKNKQGVTALHKSVAFVCENCSKKLHENVSNYVPFLKAVSSRSETCVLLLLNAGADVNVQNHNGGAPLHLAAEHGLSECLGMLLKHSPKVNIQNKNRDTPLHKAIESECKECVSALLIAGADIHIENKSHFTPLDTAVQTDNTDLVHLLRTHCDSGQKTSNVNENI